MAELYLARSADGGVVVIKQLPPERVGDPLLTGLLATEAELTRHAAHPNVVRLVGMGRQRLERGPSPYLVLEHIPGLDLRQLMTRCARRGLAFPVPLALAIVRGLLRALDAAHRARDELGAPLLVVHRDVSPANLLLGFDGQVKLCDFGIAAAATAPDHLDVVLGKASYMSPEQARGERVDRRADLYSVGVLLWELLSGRRMRKGSEGDRIRMAMTGMTRSLPSVEGLPEQGRLQALVRRALSFRPADRPQSAADMLRELDGYLNRTALGASSGELSAWLRRHFDRDIRVASEQLQRVLATPISQAPLEADVIEPDDLSRPRRIVRATSAPAPRAWWRAELGPLVRIGALSFAAALTSLSLVRWLGLL